jgi:hypothetical protein
MYGETMTDEKTTEDTPSGEETAAAEPETAAVEGDTGAEGTAEDKGRHTDSKMMILITDSDPESDESVNFEGPFDAKSDADRWIKENAEEGYDYNVARLWPTMQVKVVTTRTVTVVD